MQSVAQHSVTILLRKTLFRMVTTLFQSNIVKLCCAKNRRCETSRVMPIGQASNILWDEPNLASSVHENFDVWLSYVRMNEFGSLNTFCPSASTDKTSKDRIRDNRTSHATNYNSKLKICMIMYMLWFSFILGSNFIQFPLFQSHYHILLNQKQRKIKFKLSIKLNHNIYLVFWFSWLVRRVLSSTSDLTDNLNLI